MSRFDLIEFLSFLFSFLSLQLARTGPPIVGPNPLPKLTHIVLVLELLGDLTHIPSKREVEKSLNSKGFLPKKSIPAYPECMNVLHEKKIIKRLQLHLIKNQRIKLAKS